MRILGLLCRKRLLSARQSTTPSSEVREASSQTAILGRAAVQDEVGKQGLYTGDGERCQLCTTHRQSEVTQEMYVQNGSIVRQLNVQAWDE